MSYLLEEWEQVDEVNLLSNLVHINPCKSHLYQPFLYRIHSCFAMSIFSPSSQCFFLSSHVYIAGLDWCTFRVWTRCSRCTEPFEKRVQNYLHAHRQRHNPSRAHRKWDITRNHCGVILLLKMIYAHHHPRIKPLIKQGLLQKLMSRKYQILDGWSTVINQLYQRSSSVEPTLSWWTFIQCHS